MECGVSVAGRNHAFDGQAAHPHRLPACRVAHVHRLCIDWATAGGPGSLGVPPEFPLHLSVLPYHERRPPPGYPAHQASGAAVAIFDPQLICLNALEDLRDPAAFLGMALLMQHHIGNQQALLLQDHQRLPR